MLSGKIRNHSGTILAKALFAALALACHGAARAETLKEALTAAYLYNPTLKSAQAQLRSTDNQVSLAKSGYRPTISGTTQYGYENLRTKVKTPPAAPGVIPICPGPVASNGTCAGAVGVPLSSFSAGGSFGSTTHPVTAEISAQQNVFDGFRTYNNIKGAEAAVEAGREDLRAAEQSILLNAVTAYMNVVRDQAIVELRKSNVRVLAEQLRATEDRFRVGEVTKTDVAQAQSGLAQGQADLSIAQGTLYGDQALFAQYIGHPPRALKDPGPPERLLPKTLQAAINIAGAENPGVIAAVFRERAQQHQVEQLKGQLLPSLTANATYTYSSPPTGVGGNTSGGGEENDVRAFGQLNVPIYQAGSVSAQIRQAAETLSQARQQIDVQRELARQNVSSQWGLIIAARGNIAAGKAAVESTRIALEGVRQEEKVGQRTILDVLNAEQQNLNAQVFLVSFQRDLVVASYGVLAGMGRLSAYDIALEAELYDPTRYYGSVKDAVFGWGASVESAEDPRVAPVTDPGRTPEQSSTDGAAYTQYLPQIP